MNNYVYHCLSIYNNIIQLFLYKTLCLLIYKHVYIRNPGNLWLGWLSSKIQGRFTKGTAGRGDRL